MRMIDSDKLHLKLLDMEFPIYDQDPILDAMDDCTIDAAPVVHGRGLWQVVIQLRIAPNVGKRQLEHFLAGTQIQSIARVAEQRWTCQTASKGLFSKIPKI